MDVRGAVPDELRGALVADDRPRWHPPMLATSVEEAFSDPRWVYEIKLDGVRAIAVRDGDEFSLCSRNRKPMEAAYPEVVDALRAVSTGRYVIDGEVVAFEGGRPSFSRLQPRMHLQDPERARRSGVEIFFYVFDLLHVDGYDTTGLPLVVRKDLLRAAFPLEEPLRFSSHRPEHGAELFDEACRQRWEGLIAKRADSPYRPGTRSRDWLKFKCVARQEFLIGGFTEPRGSRTGFGALLVGYHDDTTLRYAGKVGTGYTDRLLTQLRGLLDDLERGDPPFDEPVGEKGARWVEPRLVCEVAFTEWTPDGKLRHPRFLGLRNDRDPADVVREPAGTR